MTPPIWISIYMAPETIGHLHDYQIEDHANNILRTIAKSNENYFSGFSIQDDDAGIYILTNTTREELESVFRCETGYGWKLQQDEYGHEMAVKDVFFKTQPVIPDGLEHLVSGVRIIPTKVKAMM